MVSKLYYNLKGKLEGKENLKKVLSNISWLFLDKVLRVGLNFVLTVLIARYLGAQDFGLWNYVIAFVALFSIFSSLGLDSIVVKNLVKEQAKEEVLGAAFILKLVGGGLAFVLSLLTILILRPGEPLTLILVLITAGGLLFQSFDVIDFYFQSTLQSKFVVYSRVAAFIISAIFKIAILILKGPLVLFVLANSLELLFTATFFILVYKQSNGLVTRWKIKFPVVKKLFLDSYPLALAVMVVLIYMRTDQIMLGSIISDKAVGIFSAAVRLSEAWYFIPSVITNSILPSLIKLKEVNQENYLRKLEQSFKIMAFLGIITAVIISFSASYIITFLYGAEYAEAAPILAVHTWTSVFVFLGFASGNWFVVEGLQKYVFYRTLAGALINVGLNFYLIPAYGGLGAAFATLISQFVASYFFSLLSRKTYPVFIMQTKALVQVLILRDVFIYFRKR
ncbi:O-unit flippase [Adhaeribacter aerolatus]|uniref:O-unit flippase n=1 Tax=Adhaeribacter aerolatus TaxID=670289 RepID=A0A512AYP8_9BACT|nr:flippase [Adhaeribacter aerolatus]GEO04627.1 O-unit flippase [Adhaeribacter aerolatus]